MLARLCHRTRLACVQGAKLRWMSSSSLKNKDPFPAKWDSEVDPVPASAQKEIHRLKAMEGVRVAGYGINGLDVLVGAEQIGNIPLEAGGYKVHSTVTSHFVGAADVNDPHISLASIEAAKRKLRQELNDDISVHYVGYTASQAGPQTLEVLYLPFRRPPPISSFCGFPVNWSPCYPFKGVCCDHADTISENVGSGHYVHYHHEMWTVFAQSGAGGHIAFSFVAPNGDKFCVGAGHVACYGWRGFLPFSRDVTGLTQRNLQGCDSTLYTGPDYSIPFAKTVHITMGPYADISVSKYLNPVLPINNAFKMASFAVPFRGQELILHYKSGQQRQLVAESTGDESEYYPFGLPTEKDLPVHLKLLDQILVSTTSKLQPILRGDSGCPVTTVDGALVGIVIAEAESTGDKQYGLVTPLKHIFNVLKWYDNGYILYE